MIIVRIKVGVLTAKLAKYSISNNYIKKHVVSECVLKKHGGRVVNVICSVPPHLSQYQLAAAVAATLKLTTSDWIHNKMCQMFENEYSETPQ